MVNSESRDRLAEMRQMALSLPYGRERVALRREIWRMRKEQEERKSLEAQEARRRRHEESCRRRREAKMADRIRNSGRVIKTSIRKARRDYECYGCAGECPIPRGESYFAATLQVGASVTVVRYCQRCHAAIENKLAHSRSGALSVDDRGQFRWERLSSAFRRRWERLIEELTKNEGDRERQRKAIVEFGNENRGH